MAKKFKLKEEHAFRPESQKVLAVAIHPERPEVALGDRDGIVTVYELETHARQHRLRGHVGFVTALAYSPEGLLCSTGKDTSMRLWDTASGQFKEDIAGVVSGPASRTLRGQMMRDSRPGHTMTPLCLAWSERGLLGSGGQDKLVKLWQESHQLRSFDWHIAPVTGVAFQPGTDRLFSASRDLTIRSWNPETGAMVNKYQAHEDEIEAFCWLGDKRFVSGDLRGQIYWWKPGEEKAKGLLLQAPSAVKVMAATPSGDWLFVGLESGDLLVVDAKARPRPLKNPVVLQVEAHDFAIRSLAVDDKRAILVSGGNDGVARLWSY